MFKLENSHLKVAVIDPASDAYLLGSRYCTGGYIFQIADKQKGQLLCGPTFGSGTYNAFDGQGVPEVFLVALGEETARVGNDVVVPGVGRVIRSSPTIPFHTRDNPNVREFAVWEIERDASAFEARTRHVLDKYDIVIIRRVTLSDLTVTSATNLANGGEEEIRLRWFPHPFFPFPRNRVACRFGFPFSVPDNPGYFVNAQGFVELKPGYDWTKGLYQPLGLAQPAQFSAVVNHPIVETVGVSCDYAPAFVPVWANHRTFSVEPYFETTVRSGEAASWQISYRFGDTSKV
jgi:hypothetical protein